MITILSTIVIVLSVYSVFCSGLFWFTLNQKNKLKFDFAESRKRSMLEDLEIATSDQLLDELKKRTSDSSPPFLLLKIVREKERQGITIESYNLSAMLTFKTLCMSTFMIYSALKNNGIDVPSFSTDSMDLGEGEDGEEWKKGYQDE